MFGRYFNSHNGKSAVRALTAEPIRMEFAVLVARPRQQGGNLRKIDRDHTRSHDHAKALRVFFLHVQSAVAHRHAGGRGAEPQARPMIFILLRCEAGI